MTPFVVDFIRRCKSSLIPLFVWGLAIAYRGAKISNFSLPGYCFGGPFDHIWITYIIILLLLFFQTAFLRDQNCCRSPDSFYRIGEGSGDIYRVSPEEHRLWKGDRQKFVCRRIRWLHLLFTAGLIFSSAVQFHRHRRERRHNWPLPAQAFYPNRPF
jgi:hypothetical protein